MPDSWYFESYTTRFYFPSDIFEALENNTHLRHFKFIGFRFYDSGDKLAPIYRLITHNRRLESLDLRHLGLIEEDINSILTGLVANPTMKSLDFRGHRVFSPQLPPLAIKALEANHKLTYLGIDYIEKEKIEGFLIRNRLSNPGLDEVETIESLVFEKLKVEKPNCKEESSKELNILENPEAPQSSIEPDQSTLLMLKIYKSIAILTITASFIGLLVAATILTGGLAAGVLLGCSAAFLLGNFGLFEVEQGKRQSIRFYILSLVLVVRQKVC